MQKNYVVMDIPLLTRILEECREGVESDAELHFLLTKLIEEQMVAGDNTVLTMDNYKAIMSYKEQYAFADEGEDDE